MGNLKLALSEQALEPDRAEGSEGGVAYSLIGGVRRAEWGVAYSRSCMSRRHPPDTPERTCTRDTQRTHAGRHRATRTSRVGTQGRERLRVNSLSTLRMKLQPSLFLATLNTGSGREIPAICHDTGVWQWHFYPKILVLRMCRFQAAVSF